MTDFVTAIKLGSQVRQIQTAPAPIRPARPSDLHLILDSWRRSHRYHFPMSLIRHEDYDEQVSPHIRRHLRTADTLVAYSQDCEDQILGWICAGSNNVLYYIYTKAPFRRLGIGSHLLRSCLTSHRPVIPCAFWTPYATKLVVRFPLRYDPELLEDVTR